MTRLIAGLTMVLLAASCGADGYPTEPADPANSPISISGETRIGVSTYDGNINDTDLTINFGL
jgi:hypothetical protein